MARIEGGDVGVWALAKDAIKNILARRLLGIEGIEPDELGFVAHFDLVPGLNESAVELGVIGILRDEVATDTTELIELVGGGTGDGEACALGVGLD